ncbi:phytanoyl-CoA dioxygenase family protein [Mucilaginibacter sp.]|uniref:phytanoyl-CoA dioxygenase family protein n=1 Tax=Mucilaginibacter sp. TaxID=1882438 RepID=UPI003AFF632D
MESNKTEILKTGFDRDGYVFIPGFFSTEEVAAILKELRDCIKNIVPSMSAKQVFYEDQQHPETLKQLQDLQLYSPFFNDLMTDSRLQRLAEVVLDEKVIGRNVEYFNKPPKIGKATPPHQDAYYFNLNPAQAVTMWLALEDADEENGCVSYVTGSHLKGMRAHGRTQTLGFSQSILDFGTDDDRAACRSFPAKPGDLLIHHSMTVHAAGANATNRSRKALGLIYFGISAQPDLAAKEAYLKALNTTTT